MKLHTKLNFWDKFQLKSNDMTNRKRGEGMKHFIKSHIFSHFSFAQAPNLTLFHVEINYVKMLIKSNGK